MRATCSPRSVAACSRFVTSTPPFGSDGVPTQMIAISAPSRPSSTFCVARNRPSDTALATMASSSGSTTGLVPAASARTFVGSGSIPTTSWPESARHAAVTVPT